MNNRINNTIDKFNMLSPGDRILVGVSGGADSMLLLRYLISVRNIYDITVAVAHIEHGIRGQESIDDAAFVEEFCKANHLEFYLLSIDAVNEAREQKMGVEEYSRKRRYAFFNSIPCDKIATAHNLSDNAETVLFRLARGSGLKGVCGIPPVRGKIIRPLIEISAADIRAYCENNNIEYRIDSTNSSGDYTRNYIRNTVIPDFKKVNSDFENSIASFINDANEDMEFIISQSEQAYNAVLYKNMLNIGLLSQFHISIKKRIIIKYFSNYNISLDRVHLNDIIKLIEKRGRVQIKGDYYAVSDGEYVRIADFSPNKNSFSFVSEILKISEFDAKGVDFYCDYDKIIGKAEIRTRKEGDTICPANRGCTKSLKKLFNELKIPQEIRSSIGVIADDKGVIGVIGYCIDDRVKVSSDTQNILSVRTSFGGFV
ncbi:MAG: tRNA lysidine(34) synthetase TilS [Eubacterium sp.]|nr:tRNA lysidine(34) synthetase TilS [Eubacterium sp.]